MPAKVLGVPFLLGKNNPTVALGPRFLREQGLLKDFHDLGDCDLSSFKSASEACQQIDRSITKELDESPFITIGGDHGLALGSIHAVLRQDPDRIVVWIDAHADMNTPSTSKTGNFHGMPLSYLLPFAERTSEFSWLTHRLRADQLIMIGLRDIDSSEARFIREYGIRCYLHEEVQERGMAALLTEGLKEIDPKRERRLHLSLDVDVLDPSEFASTGTRVPTGSSVEQVLAGIQSLQMTKRLRSMDLVEFSPFGTPEDLACAKIVESFLKTAFPG